MKTKHLLLLSIFFIGVNVICAQINFVNQAEILGLDFSAGTTYLGNGISFCDYNNDGWDDVTIATEQGLKIQFYKNENGLFIADNIDMPINHDQHKQINWVDFDNDGDKDLFVTSNNNGNKLYKNNGSMSFQDITSASGLRTNNIETYGASWGDYNNDGFLDVFLSNRSESDNQQNYLYKNNGDGTFADVTTLVGIDTGSHMSFCSAFFDFNNDGWQDIYISSDKYSNQNFLYKNNGDETFTDVSLTSGTGISIDAMTTTIGDFNNDGWFDIYITNTPGGNVLFKNNGDETFSNIAVSSGTSFESIGWGAVFLDADNDMDVDLYVSAELDGSLGGFLSAAFYLNNGDETFSTPDTGFIGDLRASFSNAIGDVDNDGYPEIIVNNSNNENVFLWKNNTIQNNNWLKVKLQGVISNKDGIGSKIEISINGNKQYRYTLCGEGYISQNSNTEFFGTGSDVLIDYIKVTWLSGQVDYLENVPVNQMLTIVEGSNPLSINSEQKKELLVFYPNPVTNNLTLNAQKDIQNVIVFNMLGQQVMRTEPNALNSEVDMSALNTGAYFVQVTIGNTTKTIRIIKN